MKCSPTVVTRKTSTGTVVEQYGGCGRELTVVPYINPKGEKASLLACPKCDEIGMWPKGDGRWMVHA